MVQRVFWGDMVGPARPQFVLFGSSIVQLSFGHGGWVPFLLTSTLAKYTLLFCVGAWFDSMLVY